VPVDGKKPLVKGYTGHAGGWADTKTLVYWAEYYAAANISLRLPDELKGIDKDFYKPDPEGRRAELLKRLALPPSYRSSARTDGSGILIYRVPPGLRFQSEPAPGIEIIQFYHRVVTCWPSMHPKLHRTYRWWDPAGQLMKLGTVPRPADMAELPAKAIDLLLARNNTHAAPGAPTVPHSWNAANVATRAMLIVRRAIRAMEAGDCRHGTVCSAVAKLVRYEVAGYPVAELALEELGQAFVSAITTGPNKRSTVAEAEKEWDDFRTSARRLYVGGDNEVAR
jgi:hypothetical protein